MSTKIDDGGFAYPQMVQNLGKNLVQEFALGGMTLRDYFAGQALMGMLSGNSRLDSETLAIQSYWIADAMLNERKEVE